MDENHVKYAKMIEDTDRKLKALMAKWVLRYDYFGFLFSLVRRRAEVGLPNPAAIAPTPQGTLELLYNPILVSATPDEDINEILHHEGLHILNKHISRMMRLLADVSKDERKKHISLINKAADCCVNQQGNIKNPLMIAGSPFRLHFPDDLGLEPDRMMEEYYYTLLERERQKENQKGGKGGQDDDKDKDNTDDQPPSGKGDSKPEDDDNDKEDNGDTQPSDGKVDEQDDDGDGDEDDGDGGGDGPPDEEPGDGDEADGSGGGSDPKGQQPGKPQEGGDDNNSPAQGEVDDSDLGNHQHWHSDDYPDPHATSRQIDTYTQRIIRESASNYRNSKSRGNMPGYIQDLIDAALKPVPIPYYELIRQLVKGSRIGKYKRSSTHINRKRTYVFQINDENIPMISPFPGRKRDMTFKIVILVDTSGSQTPEDIMDALSGCASIIEKDRHCETTVLEVDTKIHKEYQVKKVSDIDFEVKGRGGTVLMPGVERARELNCDVCLCFTDGYTENFNEIDRRLFPKRMIWVITPNGSEEQLNETGYVVYLPERMGS